MSLAELVLVRRTLTLSPPAMPGFMSAATANSAPIALFSLKPAPIACVPG